MIIGASKEISNTVLDKKIKEKNYFNTSAALIKQSLNEMEIIVRHLKGNKKTVYGLAGLGYLYVSSIGGRNSLMGSYIGSGLTYSETEAAGQSGLAERATYDTTGEKMQTQNTGILCPPGYP